MAKSLVIKFCFREGPLFETISRIPRSTKYQLQTSNELHNGDVGIYNEGVLKVLIERKTLADLTSSIVPKKGEKESRYQSQVANATSLRRDYPGLLVGYIIEVGGKHSDPDLKALHAMTSIVTKHKQFIVPSKNLVETSHIIMDLADKYDFAVDGSANEIVGGARVSGGTIPSVGELREKHALAHQLRQINTVSSKAAMGISASYPNMRALIRAFDVAESPEKLLIGIPIEGDRKIGKALSATVYRWLCGQ
jgi:hypothetical protein